MRDLEDPTQFGNANRSQVEIRQATEDDASAILALHQESINDQDLPHEQKAMGLDVPADLEHFSATYIGSIHNRFWLAVAPQREPRLQRDANASSEWSAWWRRRPTSQRCAGFE